jgi:hypothetical protein
VSNPAAAYDAIIASVLAAAPGGGAAEAAMIDVINGAVASSRPAPPPFSFPADAAILAELTTTAANWRVVLKHHLDDFVLPQFEAIPDLTVPATRGAGAQAWNTAAQIDKVVRKASDVAFTVPPTNSQPEAVVSRFDFKLHQLQETPGDDIANGWQLVKDYTSGAPPAVPASALASQTEAFQAIKNLAAFEGFCIRLAAAVTAAGRAQVSLAETLALWRTEGDLLVPYSETRRAAGAPTCDVINKIRLGFDTPEVFPLMKRGLWGYTLSHPRFIGLLPAGATPQIVSNFAKVQALVHWSIVAAGLDFFWQARNIARVPNSRSASVAAIARFLNANHIARWGAGGSSTAVLEAECDAVLDDLVVTAAPHNRIVVAPTTPAALVALMLGEALIFFNLDTVAGKGPVVTPTEKLKYLSYHCQDHRHRTDVAQDKFTLMLVSAAVAAARGPAGALQTSLAPYTADPTFPTSAALKSLNFDTQPLTGDTSVHVAAYSKLAAGNWWTNPANLDNLADFMLVATSVQWRDWEELRGNMARFAKLRAYYDALLS